MKQWIETVKNWTWVCYTIEVFQRFGKDNGTLNAAGLAFFMLLSFAPMILGAVGLLSKVVPPNLAIHEVRIMVDSLLPPGGPREEMNHFLGERLSATLAGLSKKGDLAGVIGLITVAWISMQIFVTGSTAMNAAFEVAENRSWLRLRITAFGLLLTSGSLLLVSLFLSAIPAAVRANDLPVVHHIPVPPLAIDALFEIIAVFVNAILFMVVYKYLPAAAHSWRTSMVGGVAASVLFEAAKKGLAVLLLRPNESVYGGLANLILFILWIYYSMMILLLGSEIAAIYARVNEPETVGHSGKSREVDKRLRRVRADG